MMSTPSAYVGQLNSLIKKKKKNILYVETYARYLLRKAWFSYAAEAPGDVAAGTACLRYNSNMPYGLPAARKSEVFTAGMPAKLNSTQLRRHAGGKDSWPLLPATSVLISEGHRRQYRRLYRW